jgi:hypothetical protein
MKIRFQGVINITVLIVKRSAYVQSTLKKRYVIFPSPAGMSLTKLGKIIPARESLVSDIPAGDGKIANLFFTVYVFTCT